MKQTKPGFAVPSMSAVRARRIHELRARSVNGIAMSYQQVAALCGCSISTVANVLTGRTHADVAEEVAKDLSKQ